LKKNLFVFLILFFVSTFAFAAGDQEGAEDAIKIAMVTDVGGVNDQSFNQSAWEGLQRARDELGVEISYLESAQDADYIPNLQSLIDGGNDLVWGVGFKMADALLQMAKLYPDQHFAIIDFAYGPDAPSNVVGVLFKAEQASFLVGYIAGKVTETNTIGFVGGIEGAIIDAFEYGFLAGVYIANRDATVLSQYADSFVDAAKGKSIATQMYVQGADIVFHAAGSVGNGVIEAAREQDRWVIGVDRDQNDLAPDNVLTSAMKEVGDAMYKVAKDLKETGEFPSGGALILGLSDGAVGIAPTSNVHVPADILSEIEEMSQRIVSGEIAVPYNLETFETFKSEN